VDDDHEISSSHRDQATKYIADLDALGQVDVFIKGYLRDDSVPFSYHDMVIAIGSQIYIPETEDEKIYGIPALDSYSCLGNLVSLKDENNNDPKQFHNLGLISLIRAPILFPDNWDSMPKVRMLEFLESNNVKARARIARYVILNLAHFLVARTFGQSLAREHMARCVAEINWLSLGGELNSYAARGVCEECKAEAGNYGPANIYRRFAVSHLTKAIDAISSVANEIEGLVEEKKVHKIVIGFSMVTVAIGLLANLLAGLELHVDKVYWGVGEYVTGHLPAVLLVAVFVLVGSGFALRSMMINSRLP